jgi:hypothetical protein
MDNAFWGPTPILSYNCIQRSFLIFKHDLPAIAINVGLSNIIPLSVMATVQVQFAR